MPMVSVVSFVLAVDYGRYLTAFVFRACGGPYFVGAAACTCVSPLS